MASASNITLTDYAQSVEKDFFNIKNTSIIKTFDGFTYVHSMIFENYLDIIMSRASLLTLSDDERNKFKYKPKYLSKYLYNTENLYYLILLMNDVTVEKFDPAKLYLINASDLSLIENIINMEKTLGTI